MAIGDPKQVSTDVPSSRETERDGVDGGEGYLSMFEGTSVFDFA
jgi:hypothetical protein